MAGWPAHIVYALEMFGNQYPGDVLSIEVFANFWGGLDDVNLMRAAQEGEGYQDTLLAILALSGMFVKWKQGEAQPTGGLSSGLPSHQRASLEWKISLPLRSHPDPISPKFGEQSSYKGVGVSFSL